MLGADVSICMLNVLAVGNNQEAENKFITVLIVVFAVTPVSYWAHTEAELTLVSWL